MNFFSKKKNYYQGPLSDHFDGEKFFNPWNHFKSSFFKVLYWKITCKRRPWPIEKINQQFDIPPQRVNENQLRVSFVGHSTVLIQTQGLNILTDPVWSKRASPFKFIGPSRYTLPGISYESLPPIDLILISHNHYDHLDLPTIKKIFLKSKPVIVTPLGNDVIIHKEIPQIEIKTLDWNQSISVTKDIKVYLVPTQHWTARSINDQNRALWGAFVIKTPGGNIYFGGDTGYEEMLFHSIFKKFGSFRFAMLPIGAYEPRWFMKYAHMNPEEAVCAYNDLRASNAMAIHYNTFRLADEGFDEPVKLLKKSCEKFNISSSRFRSLEVGESWIVPEMNNE